MTRPIRIYMHVNDLPGAWTVLEEQLNRIEESGLLDAAEVLNMCINGKMENFEGVKQALSEYTKIRYVHVATDAQRFEYPTLDFLKRECDATTEDFNICYLHLKGLTRLNDPNVVDWRHFMEYFNIDRWEDCVQRLTLGYDTVGINYIEAPWPHYSGNFWWSHANYVKILDPLVDPNQLPWGQPSKYIDATLDYGNFRYEHEAWIASKRPGWAELAVSPGKNQPGWHFENPWPESNYVVEDANLQTS